MPNKNTPARVKNVIFLLTISLLLPSISMSETQNSTRKSVEIKKDLAKADELGKDRLNKENANKAFSILKKLYKENPNNREVGWRLSRACYFVGLRLTEKKEEKEKIFKLGKDVGIATAKTYPKCASCNFWAAINIALYGDTVGVFKMLFSLAQVEEHLKQSLKTDPSYAGAGAYRLLGMIEHKLPGILGGNDKKAREFLEKAIATAPDEPLNYLFLARILLSEFDDKAKSTEVALKGVAVPKPNSWQLESLEALEELKAFLKTNPPNQPLPDTEIE